MGREDMTSTMNGSKRKPSDLTGYRFGYFEVTEELPPHIRKNGKKVRVWDCVCICGNHRTLNRQEIITGKRKSCGCMAAELMRKSNTVHGDSHTRRHNIWSGMRERCYTKTDSHYPGYGGRGITVCREWLLNYTAFRDWATANGYTDELSIDRIDNNGPYSPENCRWVNHRSQCNSTRRNHCIEINGEQKTIAEWSRISGVKGPTIRKRLLLGWSPEDAVFLKGRVQKDG